MATWQMVPARRFLEVLVAVGVVGWVACSSDGLAPARPTSLEVLPESLLLEPGEFLALTVRVLDQQGRHLPGTPVEYFTSDTTVATVTPGGVVTAEATRADTAAITARVPDGPQRAIPVVVQPPPQTIQLSPASVVLRRGESTQLVAVAVDLNGDSVPGIPITFESEDSLLVNVSSLGVITAVGIHGSTRIVARYEALSAAAVVAVNAIVASPSLSARPFGVAVSLSDLVYVARLDVTALGTTQLPSYAFADGPTVGFTATGVAFNSIGTKAYVTNQHSQNVGFIDVATATQTATVPVSADPFTVSVEPGDLRLFVTTNADDVAVIDVGTMTVVERIPVGWAPNDVVFHPSQPLAYVSAAFSGTVHEVSTSSLTVLRTLVVGGAPQGLAIAADGAELYVADESGSRIAILSVASGTVTESVSLDHGVFDIALSPDGLHLVAGVPSRGAVVVVDRTSRATLGVIDTGGSPRRIDFSSDGKTVVVANEAGWVDVLAW
jgi:YVTN family beta-propeller protein